MKDPTPGNQFPIWPIGRIHAPSSFDVLPDLRFPSPKQVELVEDLKKSLVRDSGIQPGVYSSLDAALFPYVQAVYNGLNDKLLDELSGVDAFDLCIRLYKRHEEFLGHILKGHHYLAAHRKYGDSRESSMKNQQLWESLSPYTESIRWLIEVAVKHCNSTGQTVGRSKFDLLIELARAMVEWDMAWETVVHKVIEHNVEVDTDYVATPQLTPRATKAMEAYRRALMPGMAESEAERFDMLQSSQESMSIEEMIDQIGLKELDEPLTCERGYSMSDWIRFSLGLVDSFGEKEYCKIFKQARLASFLSKKWKLDPQRLDYLLRDYGISTQMLNGVDVNEMLPVENARRDSRLLRRPVVLLERFGSRYCIYGVETTSMSLQMVLTRIESGRIDFVHNHEGRLRAVVGTLQEKLGLPFERHLADKCTALGFESKLRKDKIRGRPLPQGQGFGAVDVFIVDRQSRRFILVEAKNNADEGIVPEIMSKERQKFMKEIVDLESQVSWFAENLAELKAEYDVRPEEGYSVEGVIVVNRPRPWMFVSDRPLCIVDYDRFFKLLRQGQQFVIHPVVV